MRQKPLSLAAGVLVPLAFAHQTAMPQEDEETPFTKDFPIDQCYFVPAGGNPYFSLQPGRETFLTDGDEEVRIVVTNDLKQIEIDGRGHWSRVIEEHETEGGELVEVSRNYFSMCWPSMDVYYFGEDVDIYEEGEVVSHDGAWIAGENGARPGLIMPQSAFLLGSRYYQEVAPGVAEDRAEHVGTNLDLVVPAGSFEDCIEIEETTALEPGEVSIKRYCRDVGIVFDDGLEASDIRRPWQGKR
ncbi:MAG: hypothetical protein JXB36_17745 [Gammaproteobacteria bacterium]|nr:hypothetical protein [Gammaproteobacteria bacterium]